MSVASVLSVDDDENLQTVVSHYLTEEGYEVFCALNGEEMKGYLTSQDIDVVLLDMVLPDTDGLTLISQIRSQKKIPIIVVSGKSDTTEKIIGLEMGADDYMTKPFEMRELTARIKAVLRRVSEDAAENDASNDDNKTQKVKFGPWLLDRARFELKNESGDVADLTTGEFQLLEALVLAPNRVLSREHLFELTREGEFDAFDRAIDVQVGRLRKKLDDDTKNPQYIKTVRGIGYMFCAETQIIDD